MDKQPTSSPHNHGEFTAGSQSDDTKSDDDINGIRGIIKADTPTGGVAYSFLLYYSKLTLSDKLLVVQK